MLSNLWKILMCHAAHTAATWCYSLRCVAADVVWKIAKCRTKFRSSLQILCVYFALNLVFDGLAEFVPTAMKAEGKRVPKSFRSHSKWTPWALWGFWGGIQTPRQKEAQPPLRIYQHFDTNELIWGAICTPIGFWRGSQNQFVGHRSE